MLVCNQYANCQQRKRRLHEFFQLRKTPLPTIHICITLNCILVPIYEQQLLKTSLFLINFEDQTPN